MKRYNARTVNHLVVKFSSLRSTGIIRHYGGGNFDGGVKACGFRTPSTNQLNYIIRLSSLVASIGGLKTQYGNH